jgi:hypothetical protein
VKRPANVFDRLNQKIIEKVLWFLADGELCAIEGGLAGQYAG